MLSDLGIHYFINIWFEITQIKSFLKRDIGVQGNSLIIKEIHYYFQYNRHNMLHVSNDLASIIYQSISINYLTMILYIFIKNALCFK